MTCSASEIPYMVVFPAPNPLWLHVCVCVRAYLMHAISYCYISMYMSALLTWYIIHNIILHMWIYMYMYIYTHIMHAHVHLYVHVICVLNFKYVPSVPRYVHIYHYILQIHGYTH